jgi:uncharacterized DUF497 family protein
MLWGASWRFGWFVVLGQREIQRVVQVLPRPSAQRLDFLSAESVFAGVTFTLEDDHFSYGEQRLVTLGLLACITFSLVHTENENEIRVISFRKATKREPQIYDDEIKN